MKHLLLALLITALTALSPAFAEEKIESFASDIRINEDASLNVIETITVRAEGREIRRGIYRDFPTAYKDKRGNRYRVGFDVLGVTRDGMPENYVVESKANGKSVRIGNADVFLPTGEYTYRIEYRTTRQLGFFEDFDELYWNVTGNGWGFPIYHAESTIRLPGRATALEVAAYTGYQGNSGHDYSIVSKSGGTIKVTTTRRLAPSEGFSVAVSWPIGFVQRPTASDNATNFIRDNISTATAVFGLLVVFAFYYQAWNRRGRDPEAGAIFPRFEPPENFSPAATRFVSKMAYDRKAFAAALINMAVKGFLTIEEEGKNFVLRKVEASTANLTPGEHKIASRLLGSQSSIELDNENHVEIGNAITGFRESLQGEYETKYFVTNRAYFFMGLAITAIVIIATIALSRNASPEATGSAFFLAGWTAVVAMILFKAGRAWQAVRRGLGSTIGNLFSAIILTGMAVAFVFGQLFTATFLASEINYLTTGAVFGLIIANAVFYYLLKAPTKLGREMMDEIEGFKLYLSTAEKHRLDAMNPPDKTPELFEKYLPFALALDVENEWSEQFSSVLSRAGQDPGEYQPSWYHGSRWNRVGHGNFASAIGASVATAVASSATAPGSSSGSGGGGFSGGGGGGGGGGGW